MNSLQDTKVEVLWTATTATSATASGVIDCLGWDYAKIIVGGISAATGNASFAALGVLEGTNSTPATSIVALTGGTAVSTSAGFVIGNYLGASDPACYVFDVDCTKYERYLKVVDTPGTAGATFAVAILSKGREMPGSDTGSAIDTIQA
jgi:hypothetical protein